MALLPQQCGNFHRTNGVGVINPPFQELTHIPPPSEGKITGILFEIGTNGEKNQ
jgi:hypothetical protein